MLGGIVAITLFLPAVGAAAARDPVPASTSRATPASHQVQAVKAIVRVLPCFGLPEVRPANYLMSCADANASWKKVNWVSWGAKTALGKGDLYQNDCQPNCVSGHFHTYAAKVVLSEVTQTRKYGLLYSRATFSYSAKDKHLTETFGLAT
jgi:hypothetical protein